MDSPLPFFYYDIVSRIVPGAFTLAVLWNVNGFAPIGWLRWFVNQAGSESWEKLLIPVLLTGLAYLIGTVFEVLDYFPDCGKLQGMKWVSELVDAKAFSSALQGFGEDDDLKRLALSKKEDDKKKVKKHRDALWQKLMYKAGTDSTNVNQAFAHCHRFQAEQKMFMHLLYPTLIFEFVSLKNWLSGFQGPIGLAALLLFSFCCYSRCRRRWIQVIEFSKLDSQSG